MENAAVVRISGRIDAKSSSEIETELNSLLDAGKKNILVVLSDTEYISSSGLRVLLSALKKVKATDGSFKIADLKPFVKNVFSISGFTEIFEIYDDEKSAYESFGI